MNSSLPRHSPCSIVCIWIAALVLALPISDARAAVTRDVLIEASPQVYWIVRVEPDDQPQRVVSIVQMRPIGGAPQWKQIAQVNHRIASVSRFGTHLVVLLENGDWMTLWDGDSAPGLLPEDGSKLLALAGGSDEAGSLWAIASSGSGRIPTTAGTTQPAAALPTNTRLLYRLDQGRWKLVAQLPTAIGASDDVSLSFQDAPILIATSDAGAVRTFAWSDTAKEWRSLGTVTTAAGTAEAKLLSGADRPMLWITDENGSGELRTRSDDADLQWSRRIPLALPESAPKGAASDAVIAGGKIRVVLFTQDGKLLEYSYPLNGSGPAQLAALPTATVPGEPKAIEWVSAVALGLLTIVLISTARKSSEVATPEAIAAAGLKLAPYGSRLLAGIIDALPIVGTTAVLFARARVADPQQIDEMMQNSPALYSALAVYVLHTLISEALWGWTIGKKLCGLRVAAMDGSPADLRAIILRNILRVVDVSISFLPTLFIFVSPLRQRAGDIAAGTIVIVAEKNPPEPKS